LGYALGILSGSGRTKAGRLERTFLAPIRKVRVGLGSTNQQGLKEIIYDVTSIGGKKEMKIDENFQFLSESECSTIKK